MQTLNMYEALVLAFCVEAIMLCIIKVGFRNKNFFVFTVYYLQIFTIIIPISHGYVN